MIQAFSGISCTVLDVTSEIPTFRRFLGFLEERRKSNSGRSSTYKELVHHALLNNWLPIGKRATTRGKDLAAVVGMHFGPLLLAKRLGSLWWWAGLLPVWCVTSTKPVKCCW